MNTQKIRVFDHREQLIIGMLYDCNSDQLIRIPKIQEQLEPLAIGEPVINQVQPKTYSQLSTVVDIADLLNIDGDQRLRFFFGFHADQSNRKGSIADIASVSLAPDMTKYAIKYSMVHQKSTLTIEALEEPVKEQLKQMLLEAAKDVTDYANATHMIIGIEHGYTAICIMDRKITPMDAPVDGLPQEVEDDLARLDGKLEATDKTMPVQFFADNLPDLDTSSLTVRNAAAMFQQIKDCGKEITVTQHITVVSLRDIFRLLGLDERFVFSHRRSVPRHLATETIERRLRHLTELLPKIHQLSLKASPLCSTNMDQRITRLSQAVGNCLDTFRNEMKLELVKFYRHSDPDINGIIQLAMVLDGHESEWTSIRDEIDAIEKVFTALNQGETTVNPKSWTAIEKRRGLSQFIITVRALTTGSIDQMLQAATHIRGFLNVNAPLKHYEFVLTGDPGPIASPANDGISCFLWKAKANEPLPITVAQLITVYPGTVSSHRLDLRWSFKDQLFAPFSQVQVLYRKSGSETNFIGAKLIGFKMHNLITIDQLEPGTAYEFLIAYTSTQGYGTIAVSHICSITTTRYTRAQRLKDNACEVSDPDWCTIPLFVPESRESEIYSGKSKRRIIGGDQPGVVDKVILLVGGSGSGKSTLLSSILNWLYEVRQEDDFRLRYIRPEQGRRAGVGVAGSATSDMLPYILTNTRLPYRLHVIDTCGFGDTQGLKYDKENAKRFRAWFEGEFRDGLDQIDAVFMVMKSADNRLNAQTKFELSQILSLFSSTIERILIPIITFADANRPNVLKVLQDANIMISNKHFKFNNGAVLGDPNQETNRVQWKETMDEFTALFQYINDLPSQSFQQSHEVCQQRELLEQNIVEMKEYITAKVNNLETLIHEMCAMKKHISAIDENKNFVISLTRSVPRSVPIPGNFFDTRCRQCDYLCHRNCDMSAEGDKENCWAMDYWGDCRMCPGKCTYKDHYNVDHRVEFEMIKVTETDADMKLRYGQSLDQKLQCEKVLEKIANEMMKTEMDIRNKISRIRACLARLDQIAMRRSNLDDTDYIRMEIKREQDEGEEGWQIRMHFLQQQLDLALSIREARDDQYDPFARYREKATGWLDYLRTSFPQMTPVIDALARNFGNMIIDGDDVDSDSGSDD